MESITSKQRLTDGATFTVGQRVSFIDPQSGIYTDGVVVCFHGNDQVEVKYYRSGWSDPKYNRIVSIFTLLTIVVKPPRRRQSNEAKSRPSSKNEDAKTSEGEGVDAPKGADGILTDDGSEVSPQKSEGGSDLSPEASEDFKQSAGLDKATDISVESFHEEGKLKHGRDSCAGSPDLALQNPSRPVSTCSSLGAQEVWLPSSFSSSASPSPADVSMEPSTEADAVGSEASAPCSSARMTPSPTPMEVQDTQPGSSDEGRKDESSIKSPSPPTPVSLSSTNSAALAFAPPSPHPADPGSAYRSSSPHMETRPSPSDMVMGPWEAARVMVELRDSFLRMGAATMLNAPPITFSRGTWPQHAGLGVGMPTPMGMQMPMGMPIMGHQMAMASPAWHSLGMGSTPGDGPGPFKKRKW